MFINPTLPEWFIISVMVKYLGILIIILDPLLKSYDVHRFEIFNKFR